MSSAPDLPEAEPSGVAQQDRPTESARPSSSGSGAAVSPPGAQAGAAPLPPGAVIDGRYEVVSEIGRGGMGRVLACRDRKIGREVALKLLSPGRLDPDGLSRFAQEARAAGALNHPNVLAVYDVGTHEGQPYMVSELLRGQTLRRRLLDATPGPRQAVEWAMQVARGLAAAHQHGIVHRDLKPDNVFITDDGYAKVLDFGIAKLVDDQRPRTATGTLSSDDLPDRTPHTETGKLLGTVGYMSPEQVRGEAVDERADVFAFGIVLHEMLTGARAFKRASQVETLYAILNGQPPPLPDQVPLELQRLVRRCLEKDPRRRAQSISDLAFTLEALLPKLPEAFAESARRWPRSRTTVLAAVGAVLALAAVAAFLLAGERRRSAAAPAVAIAPFEVRAGPQFTYLGESVAELLASSSHGAVRAVDSRAALAAARSLGSPLDPQRGRAFAEGLGASSYVLGSVLEVQGRLRLQAALYQLDRGLQPVVEGRIEGEAGSLFTLVDDLAQQLQLSDRTRTESISAGPAGRLERAATGSTRSPAALKAFLEGEARLRRGEWRPAQESVRAAVIADPSFGIGQYRLATLGSNSPGSGAEQAMAEALRLKNLQSPRDQDLIETFDLVMRGEFLEAEKRYQAILRERPDEVEAWLQLGEIQFHNLPMLGRPPAESEQALSKVTLFDPDRGGPLGHLIDLAVMAGQRSVAGPLAERFLSHHSPTPNVTLAYRWELAWANGDAQAIAGLIAEIGQANASSPDQRSAFTRAIWNRDGFKAARAVAEAMQRSQNSVAATEGLARLGVVELAQGHQAAGLRALVRAARSAPGDYSIAGWIGDALALDALPADEPALEEARQFLQSAAADSRAHLAHRRLRGLAALAIRQGDAAGAEKLIQELERLPAPPGSSLSGDLALGLRARALRRQNKLREALATLERQQLRLPPSHAYEYQLWRVAEPALRGELLTLLGQPEKALPWLEATLFYNEFEPAHLGPVHLWRARALEKVGRPERAAEEYAAFAASWSDADAPLQPLLEEARIRLRSAGSR